MHTVLKQNNAHLLLFCDPVLGDEGKLYVNKELVAVYREELVPKADFLFPNQTEAEFLTGISVKSEEDAFLAIDKLHALGPKTIIITSSFYGDPKEIIILGSTKIDQHGQQTTQRFRMKVPKFERYFSGTGDLFSALMVAWTSQGLSVTTSCERTVNTLHAIIAATFAAGSKELCLLKCKSEIISPKIVYFAELC